MQITVRGKKLEIKNDLVTKMKAYDKLFDVTESYCLSQIRAYFTEETSDRIIYPDLDDLFASKTEDELSFVVNELLSNDILLYEE